MRVSIGQNSQAPWRIVPKNSGNGTTKADSAATRLAKNELQKVCLKNVDCNESKTVKKVRELTSSLEANAASS